MVVGEHGGCPSVASNTSLHHGFGNLYP
jgi:hypothetical protein